MGSVKILVVFSVRAFNLTIMSRCVGLNEFMTYATLFKRTLEQCGRGIFSIAKSFCKLGAIIRLNTFNLKRQLFY